MKRYDYIFDGFALFLAGIQIEVLFKYIQLGLGILATIVSIIISIWTWWKHAKADGRITKDEISEVVNIIKDKTDNFKDK